MSGYRSVQDARLSQEGGPEGRRGWRQDSGRGGFGERGRHAGRGGFSERGRQDARRGSSYLPPHGREADAGSWRRRPPEAHEERGPPPPPSVQPRGGGGGRGASRRDPRDHERGRGPPPPLPQHQPQHQRQTHHDWRGGGGDVALEVEEPHLPTAEIQEGQQYQGFIYSSHDQHGYFVFFGRSDPQAPTRFRRFGPHGRLARQGLPPGLVRRMERRVVPRGQPARLADLLTVQVKSKSEDASREGRVLVELCVVPDRRLLILDLNGVLFNRYPPDDPRRYKHEVERRPCLSEFLSVCFREFDVAVWSCCKRETMEVDEVFTPEQRSELVFVHDYSHTTNLWPRRSVVSPDKPLFVKDLPRLWTHTYDRALYGESGTLLLDNHVEKFEPNPVGTCLVVPDFQASKEEEDAEPDLLLSPDGPLVQHLLALARCRSPREYMAQHADCPFFPSSHPVPQAPLEEQVRSALLQDYCSSACLPHGQTVEGFLARQDMPGPRAFTLRRRDVAEALVRRRHVVCEKSDGVRYLLYVRGGAEAGAFLVDRGGGVVQLQQAEALPQCLCGGGEEEGGSTLLDGELVQEEEQLKAPPATEGCLNGSSSSRSRWSFLVFDVVRLAGEDVGARPTLHARLQALQERLRDVGTLTFVLPTTATAAHHQATTNGNEDAAVCGVRVKRMHDVQDLPLVAARLKLSEGQEHVYESEDGSVRCRSDGLVFTPSHTNYYNYHVYKFKFASQLTVDFKVMLHDLPPAPLPSTTTSTLVPLHLTVADKDLRFATLALASPQQAQQLRAAAVARSVASSAAWLVVECGFVPEQGVWELRAVRTDKSRPNAIQTAWSTVEALAERLDLPSLLAALQEAAPMPDEDGGQPDLETARVAAHYDARQAERWSEEGLTGGQAIGGLRRLNNWIKGVFLEKACTGQLLGSSSSSPPSNPEDAPFTPRLNPFANGPAHATPGHKPGRRRPQRPPLSGVPQPLRVLDVACGRGGDVGKWAHLGAHTYLGLDVSPQSVRECAERLRVLQERRRGGSSGGVWRAVVGDAKDPDLVQLARQHGEVSRFSVVSMQFALHYLCSSSEPLARFLSSASTLLEPGGLLLLSTMDQRALAHHHQQRGGSSDDEFGNSVFRVSFPQGVGCGLGVQYSFTLTSAVEACNEYVVDLPLLCRLAREEAGLRLVALMNFGEAAEQWGRDEEGAEALRQFGVGALGDDEWEAVQLYSLMAFQKPPPDKGDDA